MNEVVIKKDEEPHKSFDIRPVAPDKVIRDFKDLKINYQVLVNMFSIGLNRSDVAFALGCSVDALEKRVEKDFEDKGYTIGDMERWYGKQYIRQIVLKGQIQAALDGEWKALEWLGKNYLGQTAEGLKVGDKGSGASVTELIKIATQDDNKASYKMKGK
jgi:hypothetical protein